MSDATRYIGDGVYASHDGYHVWLRTTKDGRVHEIALEPALVVRVIGYAEEMGLIKQRITLRGKE